MSGKKVYRNRFSVLSPLEADVLKILWPDKSMKVKQIYDQLKPNRKVALSSVAVILDRLHDKDDQILSAAEFRAGYESQD